MSTRRLAVIVLTLCALCVSCTVLASAGKGGGKGRKPVAALETVPDTVEETNPPTTTLPFDPGTPITGNLDLILGDADYLSWGDVAHFEASYTGNLSNRGMIYAIVVCSQDGWQSSVYEWSTLVVSGEVSGFDDLTPEFPLVQQEGLAATGQLIDTSRSGVCIADLVYRIMNDKDHSYQQLGSRVTFGVAAA